MNVKIGKGGYEVYVYTGAPLIIGSSVRTLHVLSLKLAVEQFLLVRLCGSILFAGKDGSDVPPYGVKRGTEFFSLCVDVSNQRAAFEV